MGDTFDTIASFALPAAGFALGGPIGGAIGSGLASGISSGDPLTGLLSAGGSFIGGNLGGSLTSGLGAETLGSGLSSALGSDIGNFAGNVLPDSFLNASLGRIAGSAFGSQLGENVGNRMNAGNAPNNSGQSVPQVSPFKPSQQAAMSLPPSLSEFANLSPQQQTSNIATKGVYGGGEGAGENQYFLNLINRRLVDPAGNVGGLKNINPIESGYLSQLGLGGYQNSTDLLKNISGYHA